MAEPCLFCKDTGLRSDGHDFVVCGRCDFGNRIRNVLVAIAQRRPIAMNNVDDCFYSSPCAFVEPMVETANPQGPNQHTPQNRRP